LSEVAANPVAARHATVRDWFLAHVARPRPAQAFVPQIDGLRCVAILSVLLYHLHGFVLGRTGVEAAAGSPGWLHRVAEQGHYGVPLFFALSGYILGRPFLGDRPVSIRRYFIRRLTRLEPPYVINLLLVYAAKVLLLGLAAAALFPSLLASLVYSHGAISGSHSLVNGVAWSLEVEWQFYLSAPLIFLALKHAPSPWRHGLLWLCIIIGGWAYARHYPVRSFAALSLFRYFGFFMAGAWVAVMDEERRLEARHETILDAIGAAAWIAILACLLAGGGAGLALPALTAVVVFSGLRGRRFKRLLGWWPVYCIGAMCYTIYLYHFFVISIIGKVLLAPFELASPDLTFLLFSLLAVPLVVAACMLPYLLIERPFMIWRPGLNKLSSSIRSATRGAAP
jgi:peptidoglycan/LPS O-acetylase OafA/YrhL